MKEILEAIARERARQDAKWGFPQRRTHAEWGIILGEEFGEALREANEIHFEREVDPDNLRAELIQTAAVCISWLEHLDHGFVRFPSNAG